MDLQWQAWDLTYDGACEWSAWDETSSWFVSVFRIFGIWQWHAAYAPDISEYVGETLVERNSWAITQNRAMAQAKAWAEKHARPESVRVSAKVESTSTRQKTT